MVEKILTPGRFNEGGEISSPPFGTKAVPATLEVGDIFTTSYKTKILGSVYTSQNIKILNIFFAYLDKFLKV